MSKASATIRVRYGETDQMGVVYHGNYFTWFEVGRSEFFRGLGMSYCGLEQAGVILPVTSAQCDFIAPARYDDLVDIYVWVNKIKGVRIEFRYEIVERESQRLLAKGTTLHAFVDKGLKPVNLKKLFPQVWEVLEKQVKEE